MIPDEEFLFAVRVIEHRRPVYTLAEVGEILVGYRSTDYFAKADELIARGLLSGDVVYSVTEAGRDVVRDYGRAMMALGRPQQELAV